ncbi:hypothetical protein ANO11243_013410 [Dothideomycetidae sp. 11243]|nr:hypothetical protein ANO11243_013410 [fungal sp. No.11243]
MYVQCLLLASAAALSSLVEASVGHDFRYAWGADRMGKMLEKRAASTSSSSTSTVSLVPDPTCTPGPHSRACWSSGYSIATDFDKKSPTTGKTVSYSLEVTNTTCNPDGNGAQPCLLVNGQYPGPTIQANWGDTLSITVKNSMKYNGTSMHWHGIRQLNSCGSDGVGGITECPIAPGNSYTYKFKCTQFGTSWYHSHHSSQYGMGVMGTIVINGPASANYDIDLGTFTVNDWFYQDAWRANAQALINLQQKAASPPANNLLVNGTGKSASGGGKYTHVAIEPELVHRLRLVNPSVDNTIRVSLDNHPFTVISADFIPVNPLANQKWVLLAPGQRYDVVFTANATAGNYWFRAEVATDCLNANNGHGRALFYYSNVTASEPADSNPTVPTNGCTELVTSPFWPQTVNSTTFNQQVQDLTLDLTQASFGSNGQNVVVWALNLTALVVDWATPTLEYVINGSTSFPKSYDIIEIPNEGVWTYWIIQTLQATVSSTEIAAPPPPHPIHLHGHDFFVLGNGAGTFNKSTANLNFNTPPRRDTTLLPGDGWLALAFEANNPGAWLMHCHIAWHISEGLGVQFLEAKNQIVLPSTGTFDTQCSNWKSFEKGAPYPQDDSGL